MISSNCLFGVHHVLSSRSRRKSDVGEARRFLFSIIYFCKSIVFLCFRF